MLNGPGADAREGLPESGGGARVKTRSEMVGREERFELGIPYRVVVARCDAATRSANWHCIDSGVRDGGVLPVQRMTDILMAAMCPSWRGDSERWRLRSNQLWGIYRVEGEAPRET